MNPSKVVRERVRTLTDLPNIGPSLAADLRRLGIETPDALHGADPWVLYHVLWELDRARPDPCVLDVFLSITDFMDGNPPRVWWHYTPIRKANYDL